MGSELGPGSPERKLRRLEARAGELEDDLAAVRAGARLAHRRSAPATPAGLVRQIPLSSLLLLAGALLVLAGIVVALR